MIIASLIGFFMLSLVLIVMVIYQYQSHKKLYNSQEKLNKQITALEREVKALLSADIIFGKSVSNLKAQLNALDDRQAQVENRRSNDGGYQHALKLLSMGSAIDEVIRDCNITPAEAELLSNLHAYQMASTPAKTTEKS